MAFTDLVKEYGSYNIIFRLWPMRWAEYNISISLEWTTTPFNDVSIDQVPDQQGIYAFLIQPRIASDLNASYLIYIGQTRRSLRTRFREYLREVARDSGRPKIVALLNLYNEYLYFSCAPINPSISPGDIERQLLMAFVPPANRKFPAEVRRIIAAFN